MNIDRIAKWLEDRLFDENEVARDTIFVKFFGKIFFYSFLIFFLLDTLSDLIFDWIKSLLTRSVIVPIYAVGLSVYLAFDFRQEFLSLVYWNAEMLMRNFAILNLSLFGIIVFIFGSSSLFWVLLSSDKKAKNLRLNS